MGTVIEGRWYRSQRDGVNSLRKQKILVIDNFVKYLRLCHGITASAFVLDNYVTWKSDEKLSVKVLEEIRYHLGIDFKKYSYENGYNKIYLR